MDRLLHPTSSDEGAKDARVTLWHAAWKMFCDNPLTGVGYNNFRGYAPRYLDKDIGKVLLVHNQYLEVIAEMGLPGLLAYVGMFVASYVGLSRVRRAARRAGSSLLVNAASGIQVGLIGYAVAVFFLSAGFLRMFPFMVAVSASLPALAAGALQAKRRRRSRGALDCGQAAGAPTEVAEGL